MHIIDEPRAPNPRRVRVFLAEKGIAMRFEALKLLDLEHRSEAYRRLNPMQQVPTLVLDDGTTLTESVAICRYFEEMQPEPSLFGSDALEKARIEMWSRRVEHGLFLPVAHCFRHTHPAMSAMEQPQIAQWGEVNRARALEVLPVFDAQLERHRFLAGPKYSIADIGLLVAIDFMKPARIDRPAGLAGLARWYAEVSARPSAKA